MQECEIVLRCALGHGVVEWDIKFHNGTKSSNLAQLKWNEFILNTIKEAIHKIDVQDGFDNREK